MVTTDEPGVYIEGSHGIRTENELVCRKLEENEYGQFLGFETLTCVPIDLDAVVPEQMSPRQRGWLNESGTRPVRFKENNRGLNTAGNVVPCSFSLRLVLRFSVLQPFTAPSLKLRPIQV